MEHVKRNPMYRYLVVLTVASTFGLQTWRTLFNNFAVETAHLTGSHIGVIQSVREIPGFLALLAIFLLHVIAEHKLSALSILFLGIGVGMTGFLPSYSGLIITTLIMSFGFHYYETTNQSLTLQYFDRDTSPWVFGKIRSLGAASNIFTGIAIFLLSFFLNYQSLYLTGGIVIVLVGLWAFFQNPADAALPPQRKKMIVRKKYWLYYALTFLAGARRQIFVAFAVFLLVKRFHFSIREVTFLFIVNNLINYFLSPLIGKAIIRFGERKVLSLEYFSLIFIFLAYAFVQNRIIIAFLYIFDHIFFNFAIAIRTYFQKIGDPKDVAPSMAFGFTVNHIAAVVIPVIGGLLWMIDYKIPFVFGAVISVLSLLLIQLIRIPEKTAASK
ncbi:MAG: MFS transporter [Calditrichaeota bacterium]|nr:MFS transporter [Calditrichota bacterium]